MQWMLNEWMNEWARGWRSLGRTCLLCLEAMMWCSLPCSQELNSVPLLSQAHNFVPIIPRIIDSQMTPVRRKAWEWDKILPPGRSLLPFHIPRPESCWYIPTSAVVSEAVGQRRVWGTEVALTPPDGWACLRRKSGRWLQWCHLCPALQQLGTSPWNCASEMFLASKPCV